MKKKTTTDCDVFLSYSLVDRESAEEIRLALENAGLRVWDSASSLEPAASIESATRQAIAESGAMVVVLPSRAELSANSAVEIGAAMAWAKPVYFVRSNGTPTQLPAFVASKQVFPASRINDVIALVRRDMRPMSEPQRAILKEIYKAQATPSDVYVDNPVLLDQLATRFAQRARSRISPERLLAEMIRLRKRGVLPRLGTPPARRRRRAGAV